MNENSNILPFPDTQGQWVVGRVRELAGNSKNINWTMHFLERADERDITLRQVIGVMREGQLAENPVRDEFGGWKVTLQQALCRAIGASRGSDIGHRRALHSDRNVTFAMREQVETMRNQPYQYRHCGLENVYLVNGYTIKDSPYGEAISIHDMDGLHRAIGMYLVREKKTLTGPEARFLRHELDLSQRTLGGLLDKSSQAVARWEKRKSRIDGPSDRLLRLLYIQRYSTGTGTGKVKVKVLLERLAELDNQIETLIQFENDNGWHLRIAA